jgi:asparaginyl-tRNA synthetase
MTYEKAIQLLGELGSDKKWADDFGVEEEHLLTKEEEKPIFVYNWPKEIKAFYMPVNKDGGTVACADMLAPRGHGELIGGSERIWKEDELVQRMKEMNLNLENYKWYIDLRKYGSVPHSGFGLGAERLIKWMLNLEHIRDAIPFPRMINRIYP